MSIFTIFVVYVTCVVLLIPLIPLIISSLSKGTSSPSSKEIEYSCCAALASVLCAWFKQWFADCGLCGSRWDHGVEDRLEPRGLQHHTLHAVIRCWLDLRLDCDASDA